jgi:hypothetical protein
LLVTRRMRNSLACLLVVISLSACATRTGRVAGVVAGASTVIGTVAITAPCSDDECAVTDAVNGVVFFGIAGIALVTAVVAELLHAAR